MSKVAWIFPGQGSQFVGMASSFTDQPIAESLWSQCEQSLGFSLRDLMLSGPEASLRQTAITQPAILAHSLMVVALFRDTLPVPDFMAGHSLGEYSACVASGSLEFQEAIKIVHQRGTAMQNAVPIGQGTMAALIGMTREEVEACCHQAQQKTQGVVGPANFNGPGQIVIAGDTVSVHEAMTEAKKIKGKRAIELPVSAPFHSRMMEPAKKVMQPIIEGSMFKSSVCPIIQNHNALPSSDPNLIQQGLIEQIDHPVLWEDSVDLLLQKGVTLFLELGPSKVLSGIVKRQALDRKKEGIKSLSIGSFDDWTEAVKSF